MEFLRYQYQKTYEFHKENMKLILPVTILLFIVAITSFSVYLSMNPGIASRLLYQISDQINTSINAYGFLPTLAENLFSGLFIIVIGIVPFVFLPICLVMFNGSLIGILLGSTPISNMTPVVLAAYLLPHGFMIIPAMLLAASYGTYLCKCIILHLTNKKRIASFPELFGQLARAYLLVIVPLMIMATLLKIFVTPLIVMLF